MLGRPLHDIIILDNSPISYLFQPHHAIPISSWYSDPLDKNLLLLIPVLKEVALVVEGEGKEAAPLSYYLKRVKNVLTDTLPQIVAFTDLPIIGGGDGKVGPDWKDLVRSVKNERKLNARKPLLEMAAEGRILKIAEEPVHTISRASLEMPYIPPPPPLPTQIL